MWIMHACHGRPNMTAGIYIHWMIVQFTSKRFMQGISMDQNVSVLSGMGCMQGSTCAHTCIQSLVLWHHDALIRVIEAEPGSTVLP